MEDEYIEDLEFQLEEIRKELERAQCYEDCVDEIMAYLQRRLNYSYKEKKSNVVKNSIINEMFIIIDRAVNKNISRSRNEG